MISKNIFKIPVEWRTTNLTNIIISEAIQADNSCAQNQQTLFFALKNMGITKKRHGHFFKQKIRPQP
ncbi:hypothetical protein MXB_976 [Myxobolus squamalis]|nr:hypothetical protein MXB_976 [Myxobolus squamalis]